MGSGSPSGTTARLLPTQAAHRQVTGFSRHPDNSVLAPARPAAKCSCRGGGLATLSATLKPVRVVIADDHRLMLAGIHNALEADGGFEIVGETLDGTDVLAIVERTRPDLVILDVRMPKMDGLTCLDEVVRRFPESRS